MDWSVLLSTFGLVFVAELGDKTQLAIVAQTCKYRCPWPVFFGGSLALTAITALSVLCGHLLGNLIPEMAIRIAASFAFIVMGGLIWLEATRSGVDAEVETDACNDEIPYLSSVTQPIPWNWKAFGTTFSLLFVAELGDKTQLAVLGLTCEKSLPWIVFVGGALALICVTAVGVIGGQQLTKLIPEKLLLKISAVGFVVMGGLMGLGIL